MVFVKILNLIKSKWKLLAVITCAIVLAGYLGLRFFGSEEAASVQAATISVQKGAIEVKVSGTGSIKPTRSIKVTPNVSGTITSINFKNGQQVKKGDLLFELNNDSFRSDLERAELDLRQVEMDYRSSIDDSREQSVTAPISGQVTAMEIEKNQDVQNGSIIMVINDTSKLIFKIPVNGAQLNYIKRGQKVDVTIPALMWTLEGKVQKVDYGGTVNTDGSKFYDITIEVNNPGTLAPGLEARAVIHTNNGQESGYEMGILEWAETASVRAGISGTIQDLYVDEKENVKKGQKLCYISSDSAEKQVISQQIKLKQAQLNLEDVKTKLADCKVYASIDGVFDLSLADIDSDSETTGEDYWQVGDEVSAGQVLATITETGMTVTVSVDEVDITKVKVGQEATITADALPEKTFSGTVQEIASKGTEQNGVASFDVTVCINQPDELKENMTANVEILVAAKEGVLLLPIEAIQERQGQKYVIMAAGATGDRTTGSRAAEDRGAGTGTNSNASPDSSTNASPDSSTIAGAGTNRQGNMRLVKTGLYNETMIEITSGLKESEIVTIPNVVRSTDAAGARSMFGGGMMGGGGARSSQFGGH
ncbi:HlyD family efflux transporter periplasmic adaptor subunit [Phosphitispora sp. TUW77]|uniref:HlyD family efflux transporter periplasmic adaptor subunit n=1 Tax=Phosphitispora sp. TUW77 TaxID=3152361 RepID=UPI003AB2D8BF